jgi:hypothetical protein
VVAERRVVAEARAWPTRGPRWVSARLAREGLEVAPTTVWRVLHRQGLGTRRERLAVLEGGDGQGEGGEVGEAG